MIPGLNSQMNPAAGKLEAPARTRIPMSVPQQKLAVPDIPGFHLHWMLGTQERLSQALKAGYQFVEADEVQVTNRGLADDAATDGSTDMGSRVTVAAGGTTDQGQPVQMVLMKLRQEWWAEDQKQLEAKSDQLAAALRSGKPLPGDTGAAENRYVDQNRTRTNMFQKRRP